MQPDDVFSLVAAAEPVFAPDGKTLIFIERHVDLHDDRSAGDLEPRFSPGGTVLTFIAADPKHHGQMYALLLDGGDARAITATHAGCSNTRGGPKVSARG